MRSLHLALIFGSVFGLFCWPAPASAQGQGRDDKRAPEPYRIRQGDTVSIKFFSHPELNEATLLVRPDGFVSPQMITEIKAEGKTVTELKKELELAYNEMLLEPIITVSVISFVTPRVFIGGQIAKPGRYEIREASTLVQAIFLAGGFTPDARRSMVMRARPNGNGDWQIETVNVLRILDPKVREKDLDLRDGDYVFVPDSKMSQITKAVEAFRGFLPRIF